MDFAEFDYFIKSIKKQLVSDEFQLALQASLSSWDRIGDSINRVTEQYSKILATSSFVELQDKLNKLSDTVQRLSYATISTQRDTGIDCFSIAESIEQALPYIADEDISRTCTETVIPELQAVHRPKLSLATALALLSLLFQIFFSVVQLLPDKQLDEIISNQAESIAESREERNELMDAVYSLRDSIDVLTDEVNILREQIDDPDDLSDPQGEENTSNGQEHAAATQD